MPLQQEEFILFFVALQKKKKQHKQTMQYTRCFGNAVYVCLLQF